MNHRTLVFSLIIVSLLALTACEEEAVPLNPAVAQPTQAARSTAAPATPTRPTVAATASIPANTAPTIASPTTTSAPTGLACPKPVAVTNTKLAAKVSGIGVSIDAFDREVVKAQNAMVQLGLDAKSAAGQEALKSLKQQVLDQLINEVVISVEADKRGIKVTDNDLNARLAQMVQDAGSVDKLNDYLKNQQLALVDFCTQLRSQILGELMFNNITGVLPAAAEQVRVRHILVATPALAQTIRDQLRRGSDFAALAKQNSVDEASKANGGELGWVPRDVLAPEVDAVIFQLPVGSTSDVVTTFYGYEIYQIVEKDKARALPPEIVQSQKQRAFLAWLYAVRETLQVERFVQP